MKLAVCSDLHLEFGGLRLSNTQNADVLILSGDIFVANELDKPQMATSKNSTPSAVFHGFIQECSLKFPKVLMVMGNHEHYRGDYSKSAEMIRSAFKHLSNFRLLDKESLVIDGVLFFGGTLWTDMNKEDPLTMYSIREYMNDYRLIANTGVGPNCNFMPEDSVADHKKFLQNLDVAMNENPDLPVVVVGHHSPSKRSTKPEYEDDYIVNGAYSSNLDEFIMDRPRIKLWTHGHTHHPFDYMIGDTRIVCNPRGYIGHQEIADHFELKYVKGEK